MGETAGIFTLKAQFIPWGIIFGACQRAIGPIHFIRPGKRWDIFRKTFNRFQKKKDNSFIKQPRAGQLNVYPFVQEIVSKSLKECVKVG